MITEDVMKKIRPGAKVRVYEGKTPFEGLVIARKHGAEPGATFTVRTILAGVGVLVIEIQRYRAGVSFEIWLWGLIALGAIVFGAYELFAPGARE